MDRSRLNPYQSPTNANEQTRKPRALIRTSVLETWIVGSAFWFWLSFNDRHMLASPRIDEWCGWLPRPWSTIVFLVLISMILSAVLLLLFPVYFLFPKPLREHCPIVLAQRGRPPLLGALIYVAGWAVLMGIFGWLVRGA